MGRKSSKGLPGDFEARKLVEHVCVALAESQHKQYKNVLEGHHFLVSTYLYV